MGKWIDAEMPPKGNNMDGFKALASAVVLGAVKEYGAEVRALDRVLSKPIPQDPEKRSLYERKIKNHEAKMKNLEKFFRGEWCSALVFLGTSGEIDTSELDFVGFIKRYVDKSRKAGASKEDLDDRAK